jgi:hypothetical protein
MWQSVTCSRDNGVKRNGNLRRLISTSSSCGCGAMRLGVDHFAAELSGEIANKVGEMRVFESEALKLPKKLMREIRNVNFNAKTK